MIEALNIGGKTYLTVHQAYIAPGVDGAVMRAQAEKRRDKQNEVTVVHDHSFLTAESNLHSEQREHCNNHCAIYIPDYQTIPLHEFRAGAIPERKVAS